MKAIAVLTAILAMVPGARLRTQGTSADEPIRVFLPAGIDRESCRATYQLVGPFGGYGGFAEPTGKTSALEIETAHDGSAVESVRAIFECTGYQLEALILDALPAPADRTFQLNPKPLGTLRFVGQVQGSISHAQVLYVDVDYAPLWICEFFRRPDCGLGIRTIASGRLDTEGNFSVTLPDFARDSVIASLHNPGELSFRIRDQETLNVLFELKPATSESEQWHIRVANRYPGVQIFDAELPR